MNQTPINTHPRISIALCTYNGEKYLKEQLDSFVQQTLSPYELVVCDDCSSDSTLEILEKFSRVAPFTVRIFHNENNLGLIKNFSKAASLCQGEYIAFSDQDDIWLPDKLEACFQMMKKAEYEYGTDIPLLVHTDLCLIDTENHVIAPSWMKVKHISPMDIDPLKNILAANYVSGCTSLGNRILLKESLPFPKVIMNHDGWCALIAASRGKILFIQEAKVLYRQHASNFTKGVKYTSLITLLKSFKSTLLRSWRSNGCLITLSKALNSTLVKGGLIPGWAIPFLAGVLEQAKELEKHLSDLSCEVPPLLKSYINALQKGGILNAFRIIFFLKIRQQGFIPNIIDFYIVTKRLHLNYSGERFWL